MGLDMYLRGEKFVSKYDHSQQAPEGGSLEVKRPVIDGFEVCEYILDMGYWRKFAPLHKYIVKVFAGGVDKCQPIHLTSDDCKRIAQALRDGGLPDNEDCGGFFFGDSEFWDEDRENGEENAKVFERAAEWVESNSWNTVTYQASW